MMATSACEAPDAMLRVYCSWPGLSMTTKRRVCGVEVAPGDVDGDALLALGDEAVEQQAEVGMRAAGRRVGRAIDRLALVVVEVGGVPQQAADQRRLAVVDRSARQTGAGCR